MNNKYKGKTRLETMLVMLLLIIFGVSTYTLVVVTATSYEKTQKESSAKDNLRLASSYVESKLNQADKKSIKIDEFEGSKAIIIEEKHNQTFYQTAIYHKDGVLREIYIKKDTKLDDTSGFEIAEIDGFDISYIKQNMLDISFEKTANEENYKMQTIVNLN